MKIEEIFMCPKCGYIIPAHIKRLMIVDDIYCPRCKEFMYKNFKYRQWWIKEDEADWWKDL